MLDRAKNRPTQAPPLFGFQFQSDQKQHQHHAEFGKVQDVLHLGDEAQSPGSDGDARCKVTHDGAQTQTQRFARWYGDHSGAEVDKVVDESSRGAFHVGGAG